jgi:hypothetical protein
MFVAVGRSARAAYSEDGVSWTKVADTGFGDSKSLTTINAIAYGGGKFVAIGDKGQIVYSNNQE